MTCASVKAWIRERFDQGLPLEEGFEPHLDVCEKCRAYVSRLRAVETGLADLAVEAPSAGFEPAVVSRIHAERQTPSRTWAAGLVVLTVFALAVLGWRIPLDTYVTDWLARAAAWSPEIVPTQGLLHSFSGLAREAWASLELPAVFASMQSSWISWGGIAALVGALVGFNALLRFLNGESRSDTLHGAK